MKMAGFIGEGVEEEGEVLREGRPEGARGSRASTSRRFCCLSISRRLVVNRQEEPPILSGILRDWASCQSCVTVDLLAWRGYESVLWYALEIVHTL